MYDDSQGGKATHSSLLRYRSPTFSKEEVKILLDLIESCKGVILDKSTCAAACHAKENAWYNITKAFNSKGFKHERSVESLKMKWDNLKKVAKKFAENIFDNSHNEFDDVASRTVQILSDAQNINNSLEKPIKPVEVNESEEQTQPQGWNSGEDEDSNDNDGTSDNKRSMNFSPQECNLLIQCVKKEKKLVLSKATTSVGNKLKRKAWFRITNNYNRLSPQKRSTKVLQTKFTNMKRMARSVSFRKYFKDLNRENNKLSDENDKKIKSEPLYEDHSEAEIEDTDDDHSGLNDNSVLNDNMSKNYINLIPDPLTTTHNGDSGIDLVNPMDNKEIVRLKMELLQYKMETAKLERKRIEEALRVQALENSLRLRTARLEAVAAACKLPPEHPALVFTPEEAPAQKHFDQST